MLYSSGTTSEVTEDGRRVVNPMPPAQQKMVDAIYQPMRATLSEQLCNRSEAIGAIDRGGRGNLANDCPRAGEEDLLHNSCRIRS